MKNVCTSCDDVQEFDLIEYNDGEKLCDYCNDKDHNKMNEDQLLNDFKENVLPWVLDQYSADDVPAMNEAFNNYKDSLHRDNIISNDIVNNTCFDI
mgnify:CR=1 FL=1